VASRIRRRSNRATARISGCDTREAVIAVDDRRSTATRGGEATMAFHVRRIDYFSTTVRDDPGEAYKLLATLANLGVNLLAFTAVPIGPLHTQLTIFPEDSAKLANEAKMDRLVLDGPHPALLVQGDDELGALAGLHMKLMKANVNVYAATGVADGGGSFGYVIYVRPEQYSLAVAALGV